MKRTSLILNLILVSGACITTSAAATFTEVGDAGDTLATAQTVSGGANPLTSISGTLVLSDADIYRLYIPLGSAFSASTAGGTSIDTQLFLLDANGFGVYAMTDRVSNRSSPQVTHSRPVRLGSTTW
jgi:hypothetical protein